MSCVLVVFEVEILLRWFQLKQVSLSSLGEPYCEGKDSCRVFILYMHILYLHELVLIAKWLTRAMIILQMGDNHDNENHEALPQPPPSLAQAVAALIADRNEQTELIRQLVQAQANAGRGRQAPPPPPAETDYVGFLATQPPLFHKTDDPLETDAWIRTI